MTGQDLKNSILQLAIQGKLVPQDPHDEPASVLLAKIREEKEQMVKENKLKKSDLITTPISEDEKAFDIPEGWEWCRLQDIGLFERGSGIKRDETTPVGFPCIRYGEMYTEYCKSPTFDKTISFTSEKVFNKSQKARKGDIFMALTGENKKDIARAALYVGDEEIAVGGDLCHFTVLGSYALYIVFLINSNYFSSIKEDYATGNIIVHISTTKLGSVAIPLPPLAEQHRIVAKIEQLMPLVEEYDKAQSKLDALNASLPDRLRASVIQRAIMGKLVPQDPHDEPASVLLAKIREEKEQMVRDKKLSKKDLTTIPVTEDETFFEIPKRWGWCRLRDIVYNQGQKTPNTKFSYIDIGSIDNKKQKLNDQKNVIEANKAPSRARKIVSKGDIIYSTVRPYLHNIAIIDRDFSEEPIASTGFAVFSCFEGVVNKYLFYYLISPFFDAYANDKNNAKGMAYPAINDDKLYKALVPLPPLAEQHRIVERLELILHLIDKLKKQK